MKREDDSDVELVVDWRGNLAQNAAAVVKNDSSTKASAAPPVYYDLSDSEGTPIARPRLPVRTLAERRAAASVKPTSMSLKQNVYADIVTLDSDSEEEISPGTTSKSAGKVDKLTQPRTQGDLSNEATYLEDEGNVGAKLCGTIFKFTDAIPKGGLLEKAIYLDNEVTVGVSKFSENPVKLTETTPSGGLLEKAMSVEIEGCLVGAISSRSDLRPKRETTVAVQMCDLPPRSDRDVQFSRDAPSSVCNALPLVHELNGSMQNSVIACDDILLQTASGSRTVPSFSVKHSGQSDPAQGLMRTIYHSLLEENQWSSPPKPAFEDDFSPITKIHFPGKLGKLRAPNSEEGILGNSLSLGNKGITGSISINDDVDVAVKAATGYVADLLPRWDNATSPKLPDRCASLGSAVVTPNKLTESDVGACHFRLCGSGKLPSCAAEGPTLLDSVEEVGFGAEPVYVHEENRVVSPIQPVVEVLTSDDEACNSEPEWLRDHEPASPMESCRTESSVPQNYGNEECSEQLLPNSGGNEEVRDYGGSKEKLSGNVTGLESHRATTVSSTPTEGPKILDPVPGVVRNYLPAVNDSVREVNRRTCPDHLVVDLTGDDDDCSSESEWMRDQDPVSPSKSLYSGGSVPHNLRFQGSHDQFLPASGADSHASKRPLLQIPGLESPHNLETTLSPSANDLESGERILGGGKAKRRRRRISGIEAETRALDASNFEDSIPNSQRASKARRGPVSEEELASIEAQKQRERELKKARQEEEKKRKQEQREELKRQKVEAAEKRKQEKELEKENNRWRKGKFALQNTTVYVDNTVLQIKNLGHLLLQQLSSKDYKFEIGSNPIQKTIVWKMRRPSADSQVDMAGSQADDVINSQLSSSQLALEEVEMKYLVVVLQGEEFADLVGKNKLLEFHSGIRNQYPTYSICYIINGLMKHLHKKEQHQYKTLDQNWRRPDVEQALAEFITHHPGVQSRLCIDESEIADHIVGLTRGLAECPFKQKLTSVSVHSNGDHVAKGDPNKDIIKKNVWLKFLVAIPSINGAIAIAIANQYPTMRALLDAYLDRRRPDHEKELLLQDLIKETSGGDSRRVGPLISRRIYRILMAKDGSLSTEDVDEGADHFT